MLSSAPSRVKDVQISSKPDSVSVVWVPGPGKVDSFLLSLGYKETTVQKYTVSNLTNSYTFTGLTAGRLYNLTMISVAARLENSTSRAVQTGNERNILLSPPRGECLKGRDKVLER